MSGWVKIFRDIQESWIWKDKEPFDKRAAWVDLILLANHKNVRMPYRGGVIEEERGTVYRSISFLAARWGWSRHKVSDYLQLLENDGMIRTEKRTGVPASFTLVNYDKYQGLLSDEGQEKGQVADRLGTGQGQVKDRSRTGNKNEKNVKKYIYADGENARAKILLEDGTFYVVTDEELQDLSARYPMLSVPAELQTIESWCEANPGRRKTRSGARRFIVNWLNKAKRDMDTAKMAAQTYAAAGLKPTPKNSFHNFEQRSDSLEALFAGDIVNAGGTEG